MPYTEIEYINGQESHTSNWGKYYIKGLEAWQVKEDFDGNVHDKHHNYTGYVCCNVPEGTMFTIFEQNGDKRGTDTFRFSICTVDYSQESKDPSVYGNGFCNGGDKVIAQAITKTKAPRLMDWWTNSANKSLEFAEHCAAHIDKRGLKVLPPLA